MIPSMVESLLRPSQSCRGAGLGGVCIGQSRPFTSDSRHMAIRGLTSSEAGSPRLPVIDFSATSELLKARIERLLHYLVFGPLLSRIGPVGRSRRRPGRIGDSTGGGSSGGGSSSLTRAVAGPARAKLRSPAATSWPSPPVTSSAAAHRATPTGRWPLSNTPNVSWTPSPTRHNHHQSGPAPRLRPWPKPATIDDRLEAGSPPWPGPASPFDAASRDLFTSLGDISKELELRERRAWTGKAPSSIPARPRA